MSTALEARLQGDGDLDGLLVVEEQRWQLRSRSEPVTTVGP